MEAFGDLDDMCATSTTDEGRQRLLEAGAAIQLGIALHRLTPQGQMCRGGPAAISTLLEADVPRSAACIADDIAVRGAGDSGPGSGDEEQAVVKVVAQLLANLSFDSQDGAAAVRAACPSTFWHRLGLAYPASDIADPLCRALVQSRLAGPEPPWNVAATWLRAWADAPGDNAQAAAATVAAALAFDLGGLAELWATLGPLDGSARARLAVLRSLAEEIEHGGARHRAAQAAARATMASVVQLLPGLAGAGGGEEQGMAPAMTEACLQILRGAAARDDGGAVFGSGADLVAAALEAGLVPALLGALRTLGPPQRRGSAGPGLGRVQLRTCREGSLARGGGLRPGAGPPAAEGGKDAQLNGEAMETLPGAAHAAPPVASAAGSGYATAWPTQAPYPGYRSDLMAVLANTLHRRATAQDALLDGGGATLLLEHSQADAGNPLAREWALWALRNLCAGSARGRTELGALRASEVLQTNELQQMGLELRLDPATGKLVGGGGPL